MRTIVHNFPKYPPSDVDLKFLRQLGMQRLNLLGIDKKIISLDMEKEFWHPPAKDYLKYNIDGASKGNPGTTRYEVSSKIHIEVSLASFITT